MTKMWIALIVTNAIWAGAAFANSFSFTDVAARVLAIAGQSPTKVDKIIQTDEDGYVICSPERKP